jgi:hypothetical protein
MRGIWLGSAFVLATSLSFSFSGKAKADTMDPALGRLVLDERCRATGPSGGQFYNPQSGFKKCATDDAAFAKLIAQYGYAVAPSAMRSARSTGYGGFELAIEADYTKIDSDAEYWQRGTQGPQDPSTKYFSVKNENPDDLLQVYELKIRKGFPFGLELQGAVGFLANTNIVLGGADVRVSLLEGFRTGIPAILPDIAVGGSVRTITGTEEFQLTVAGFDAQVSKGFPISGTVVLTPYVGYQWIRIFGDSGLIDLTPNTDAVNFCGYQGPNTPVTPDPNKKVYDGQPVCGNGSAADFNNTVVFDPVRLTRHRLHFGSQLRFQMVKFGAHFIMDLVSPKDANQGNEYESPTPDPTDAPDAKVNKFEGVKKQWTLAFDIGAIF